MVSGCGVLKIFGLPSSRNSSGILSFYGFVLNRNTVQNHKKLNIPEEYVNLAVQKYLKHHNLTPQVTSLTYYI